MVAHRFNANDDFAAFRELDGVAGEVDQHLTDAGGIALDVGRHVLVNDRHELEPLREGPWRKQLRHPVHERDKVERLCLEEDLIRLDSRDVENVVDQFEEAGCSASQPTGVLPLLHVERGLVQEFRHADDGIHRRSDLVAHRGQERALRMRRGQRFRVGGREFAVAFFHLRGGTFEKEHRDAMLGDIAADGDERDDLAVAVADRHDGGVQPVAGAILRAVLKLPLPRLAAAYRRPQSADEGFRMLAGADNPVIVANQFFARVLRDVAELVVDVGDAADRIRGRHDGVRIQPRQHLLQHALGFHARRYIPGEAVADVCQRAGW